MKLFLQGKYIISPTNLFQQYTCFLCEFQKYLGICLDDNLNLIIILKKK